VSAPTSDLTHYIELGFGLVHIPPGTKGPRANGWQDHPIVSAEEAARVWRHGGGIGLHHAASGTAVLDIDHPAWAALALAAVDIDLDALLAAPGPKIRSAKGLKPVYRLPDGVTLARHALTWHEPGAEKAVTVFELRAGKVQDVLPPSIHPDTGKPYTWEPAVPLRREDIPELPGGLLALWQHWQVLKPVMDKAQPWAAPPPPRAREGQEGGGVIGAFNERYTVHDVLAQHGYIAKGEGRWLSPNSSSGVAGVVLLRGDDGLERVYCHHASDPLATGHAEDAFGAWCILEHGGDMRAAVREAAEELGMSYSASAPTEANSNPPHAGSKTDKPKPQALITRLSDVEPQEVAWLWHPYVPLGKLTLLEGDPGLGKTFISLSLAAAITRGWPLPSQTGAPGTEHAPADVLCLSAEDGLADTLRPRLDAAGADVSRVHALTGWRLTDVQDGTTEGAVSLGDIPILEQALTATRAKLVVVDPLQAYLGAGVDMHRANEVRPILAALGNLAERHGCAVVCVRHLSKNLTKALYSGMGSIDFAAAARSILTVGEHEGQRLLAHVKSSLAPQGKSIRYELRDGSLFWLGPSDVTAEELRVPPPRLDERSSLESAVNFLEGFLADGPQSASTTFRAAKQEGISERTLKRAKEQLEVQSRRESEGKDGKGKWIWSLGANVGTLALLQANPVTNVNPATVPSEGVAPLQGRRAARENMQGVQEGQAAPLEDNLSHLVGTTEGEL
jgi:hypothetical protein